MVGNRSKEELKSTGRDIFTWLILASVFFIPLQLPVGATSRLSLADLFVVLASPLLLLRFKVVGRAMLIAPLLFPLIMIYGALLGGLVNGQVLAHAMVAKVLGAVVLLFSLLSWLQVAQESERGIFDLMKAFLLGSVVFTLFGLVEFYAGVSIITVRFIETRFSGGYFDPNHYGALTGVGLMFIAALGRDIFKRDSSIYIVGGILGVGLLLCISRGAWIASIFGILVVVAMRPIKIKAPVIALGVFVVLGILFSGVLEHLAHDINDRPDNASHRLELITEGLRLLKDGHFVGIGLSVFLEKNEIIIHNSVVWMTVEMGIVGVALYLLFIGEPVVRLMRLRSRNWRKGGQRGDQVARISASLLGAHLLMAVASQLVEATYQRQWWLVLALTVGLLTRTNVSSSRSLFAYFFDPNKLKTSWAQLSSSKSGWPTPWRPLWGNTGIKQEVASGTGSLKSLVSDNDTFVSDPTVLLSIPISDSAMAAYDQIEEERSRSESIDKTSTPDREIILAEDDDAPEKEVDIDSETQYLPISELVLTDEEQAEQEKNCVNRSNDSSVSNGAVVAENDIAIEEEIDADSETQYLPIQEINHSDSIDDSATSDDVVILPEDEIAIEKGMEVGSETQYLPISELILTDKEQAEQELNRVNSSKGTFIYTAAAMLAENDTETEKETDADSETQYLPIQEVDYSSSTDDSSISDGEDILAIDDSGTEKVTDDDSETQYLPIQEVNHSGSTDDSSISDDEVIFAIDDSAIETEVGVDSETQYLPIQEMDRSVSTDDSSTSDGEGIFAIDDFEIEEETDADPETHYIPIQETNHSDSANDPSIFEVLDTLEEKTSTTEKETNDDSETQYLPVSNSLLADLERAEQKTKHFGNTSEASISDVEAIVVEGDIAMKEESKVNAGTQYLPTSDSTLVDSDQADQETCHSDGVNEISIPDAEAIAVKGVIAPKEKMNVDAGTQDQPISDSILTNNDRADQETNHSDSMSNALSSDAEVIREDNGSATEKEVNADCETNYSQISETSQMNIEQTEQETIHANGMNDNSTAGDEYFLEEEIGEARIHHTLNYDIEELIGIDQQYGKRLREFDIDTTQQLLNKANTSTAITDISNHIDQEASLIRTWVSMADLIQIPGVRGQFSKLIAQSGVLSIKQLAIQDSHELAEKISDAYEVAAKDQEIKAKGNRYRAEPDIDMVTVWIDAAKKLTGNEVGQETNYLDSTNETSLLNDEVIIAEDDIAMEEEAGHDVGTQNPPVIESTSIYNNQPEQETNDSDTDSPAETSLLHTEVVLEGNDGRAKEETNVDSETQPISDSILINNDQAGQEASYSDDVNDSFIPGVETILAEDDIEIEKESNLDSETEYRPNFDSTLIESDQPEQGTNCCNSTNEVSAPDVEGVLVEEDGTETDKETNLDSETQYRTISNSTLKDSDQAEQGANRSNGTDEISDPDVEGILVEEDGSETEIEANLDFETQCRPIVDSILVDSDQAEQEINCSDSAGETSRPDAAEILVENSSTTEKETDVDAETLYFPIPDSIPTDSNQAEQETNCSDGADETFLPDATEILVENNSTTEKKTDVDGEAQYLPISDSILTDSNQAEQETNCSDSAGETSLPDAVEILVETSSDTEKETDVDAETLYFPISESVQTDSDQAEQDANCSDSMDEHSSADAAVALVENDSPTEKGIDVDVDVDVEMQYLPISESILTDNDQAEQETNRSDLTDDTSLPDADVILAEGDGNSWMRGLDYDIEEIKGIGKQSGQRLREIDIDTTQQLLEKAKTSAAITKIGHQLNNEESMVESWVSMADLIQVPGIRGQFAEQMMQAGVLSVKQLAEQDAHELMENISDAYELTQQNSEVAAKGNRYCSRPNIDMIAVWIDAAKKLNEAQSEQEKNHSVSANDSSILEVQTILAEDDIEMEKEMNHRENSADTSLPIAEIPSAEDNVKEEAMSTDLEVQYLPVSELILTDRDQADQETNDRDTTNIPSTPDAAVTLVENDIAANRETNANVEMQYLSISESILINNVQAEQETNHLDNTNNNSIPTVAMILTEDVGDSSTDLRDYAIEEIRGIGKRSAERLQEINIETTLQLLKQASASAAVVEISRYINEKESLVRAWISTADLMRVPGIRGQFAEQLVLSGVLSVKQLAVQDAQELTAKNLKLIAKDNRYYAKPNIDMVAVWIDAAKDLNDEY